MADMRIWHDHEGRQVAERLIAEKDTPFFGHDLADIRYVLVENGPTLWGCKAYIRAKKLPAVESALTRELAQERGAMPADDTRPTFVLIRPYPSLLADGDSLEPIMFHGLAHIGASSGRILAHGRDGGFDSEVSRFGRWRGGLKLPLGDSETWTT